MFLCDFDHRFEMIKTASTFLSRLMAICSMLCVVAVLNAGFIAVQNDVKELQHQASGDVRLTDGGWQACEDCDGHLTADPHSKGIDLRHHHNAGETPSALLPMAGNLPLAYYATVQVMRPGRVQALASLTPATPDHPPRV
jgi:hypothetical protein